MWQADGSLALPIAALCLVADEVSPVDQLLPGVYQLQPATRTATRTADLAEWSE